MANTDLTTARELDIQHLLGHAEALEAACRHGASMIQDGDPVAHAIRETAGSLPKRVAQIRNAHTGAKARRQIEKLLIELQQLTSLFQLSQNHTGLDELTLAVIENEIRQFRDKVEGIRAEASPA